jgi:hypothetical protein
MSSFHYMFLGSVAVICIVMVGRLTAHLVRSLHQKRKTTPLKEVVDLDKIGTFLSTYPLTYSGKLCSYAWMPKEAEAVAVRGDSIVLIYGLFVSDRYSRYIRTIYESIRVESTHPYIPSFDLTRNKDETLVLRLPDTDPIWMTDQETADYRLTIDFINVIWKILDRQECRPKPVL